MGSSEKLVNVRDEVKGNVVLVGGGYLWRV